MRQWAQYGYIDEKSLRHRGQQLSLSLHGMVIFLLPRVVFILSYDIGHFNPSAYLQIACNTCLFFGFHMLL